MKKLPIIVAFLAGCLVTGPRPAFAQTDTINLPYGLGSVQLPWQNPEVVVGSMKPIKGGLVTEVYGFSFDILTIGKLSSGYRILDGNLGGILAVPNSGAQPDAYAGIGHDIVQDIAPLKAYASSLHLNFGTSYSNAAQGWLWGGTISYELGSSATSN